MKFELIGYFIMKEKANGRVPAAGENKGLERHGRGGRTQNCLAYHQLPRRFLAEGTLDSILGVISLRLMEPGLEWASSVSKIPYCSQREALDESNGSIQPRATLPVERYPAVSSGIEQSVSSDRTRN